MVMFGNKHLYIRVKVGNYGQVRIISDKLFFPLKLISTAI